METRYKMVTFWRHTTAFQIVIPSARARMISLKRAPV
jgi:hypothetical protein